MGRKLDSLRWRNVDRYDSNGKLHFQKLLSVTLTFEPMTLKMSLVSRGSGKE